MISKRDLLSRLYYARYFWKFARCGSNIMLSKGGVISRPEQLSLGSNVYISRGFHISARDMTIGSNVMIGPDFLAECDDHMVDRVGSTMFSMRDRRVVDPIKISDDVWIGGRVTLLKGSQISEGCVVGAGSLVTKRLPPYSICVGSPCRPVRRRFTTEQLAQHLGLVGSDLTVDQVLDEWVRAAI
jgi:acetyltransferase-like isoleucine patch superfamily enzyme